MKIALTGASGFIGKAVQVAAHARGWQIIPVVRSPAPGAILWDGCTHFSNPSQLEGLDAVIHLGGESIFNLWTQKKRAAILNSRVSSTELLARTLAACKGPPKVLITISAVGYYGDTGDEWVEPKTPAGSSFLAQVCQQWEDAAQVAVDAGIRVTHPRLGMVLDPDGGALKTMIPIFRAGMGAVLGTGEQWISWIGRKDAAEALCWAIETESVQGAWNLVTPEPIQQKTFARELASALHRPCWLRIPAPILRFFGGEFAQDLLLSSCKAAPPPHLLASMEWHTKKMNKIFSMI